METSRSIVIQFDSNHNVRAVYGLWHSLHDAQQWVKERQPHTVYYLEAHTLQPASTS